MKEKCDWTKESLIKIHNKNNHKNIFITKYQLKSSFCTFQKKANYTYILKITWEQVTQSQKKSMKKYPMAFCSVCNSGIFSK